MINENISVVTVTLNDRKGLEKTLDSLSSLKTQPGEILVIDGGSDKSTIDFFLAKFSVQLPQLKLISDADRGIYDAMNKGRLLAIGKFIHYLNSGDTVFGEPYHNLDRASLLPVHFIDEKKDRCGIDRPKLFGTAYNHQGIIFKRNHPMYNIKYKIAADYLCILHAFPHGLYNLPLVTSGGVLYTFGGISTKKTVLGSLEMMVALVFNKPFHAFFILPIIIIKMLIPKTIRRFILRNFGK